jgi:hypothetical protein
LALAQPPGGLDVSIVDDTHQPVAGVRLELRIGDKSVATAVTDERGHATFADLPPAHYRISASRDGLEPVQREIDLTAAHGVTLEITAVPSLARRESIDVSGKAAPVEQGATAPTQVDGKLAKELPNKPATVADALPMVSGVVREPGGGLIISASPEHRNAFFVNSADVTDPATGQFGLTVPIDSVEVLNVYQTAYLAEFGRFSSGLVTVETKRGGEKWKWELNDPLPEFRIRSWHLHGLRTATPRLNFEGPIIPGKLFISEGSEYEIRKTAVYTLPFPRNQKRQSGINSFTQLDWILSDRHLVTSTFHAAPQRLGFVNMDYFNPESTTPDASTHNYTGTMSDKLTIFGGLLETTFSVTQFDASIWAQGEENLIITPIGNQGNYFAQKSRTARRTSGRTNYSFAPVKHLGTHNFKMGAYFAGESEDAQVQYHPIDILDTQGRPVEHIGFLRPRQFGISDTEYAVFGQDHWVISPRLALDLGVRTESQQVSGAFRVAPRGGIAWNISRRFGTTLRAGFGFFYEHVPLNVYWFNRYPDQVLTMYNTAGDAISGPIVYLNTLGQTRVRSPFIFQSPIDGNFSPRSINRSYEIEQPLGRRLKLLFRFLKNESSGLVIQDPLPPDRESANGAVLLSGSGEAHYRQYEVTGRVRVGDERELYISYVRSRGNGDLNDFANYLGTFPTPIIRPNVSSTLPADLPNRFLSWGAFRLKHKVTVAPAAEFRSGFPYLVTDAAQRYVGLPYSSRFPNFLSIDMRVSKDIQLTPKYAVRLAGSGFNLTNHFNPEAVHGNVADPAYGFFFGHRGRRFTVDFDFLF